MKNNLVVCIADDHEVVRNGMVRLLRTFPRIDRVFEAADGGELIAQIRVHNPDAVILDIEMPMLGGQDAAAYVLAHFPDVKILILTMHTEDVFVSRMIDLGVHGYLTKSVSPDELETALYSIVDKDFYQSKLVERLLSRISKKKQRSPDYSRLSPREIEILLLICQELAPKEISDRLQISEKTFFNHRSNILNKTGMRTNVGLLKYAVENSLFQIQETPSPADGTQ